MSRRFFPAKRVVSPFLPFLTVLLVVTVLSYNPLMAEEEEWRLVYEADGINIHKRVVEGSRFFEFKAMGNLRGTISEYVSVLLDTDNMPDWAPRCLEARNIEWINDRKTIIYVACNGVWPVADRDYIARLTLISDPNIPTVRVNVEHINHPNAPIITGRVHIPHLRCYWIFKKIDLVHTHVELHAYVDPGGWLPAWLVNWGYRKIPYRFLKGLETQVVKRLRHTTQLATASNLSP